MTVLACQRPALTFSGGSKYVGNYTWENLANPNNDLRFGPMPT
jgi:hypothetical protein